MMSSAVQLSEQKVLRRIAKEYERDGYAVLVEPSADDLPEWLAQFRIDLVASNDNENVIVEVKSQPYLKAPPAVDALARAVESHSGWRLDFVVTSSRGSKLAHQRERLLDVQELRRLIQMGEKLLADGLPDPAMLILWSAIEGALRRSAVLSGIPVGSLDSVALLKDLHFQGLLSSDQYRLLRDSADIRNAMAHGLKSPTPSSDRLEVLHDLASDLVRAA